MADLRIRLTPRAGRDQLGPERDGVLLVRVNAPPVDGKANAALCKLLAKAADVPASTVTIARGHRARDKLVRVEGVSEDELRRRLGLS